MEREEMCRVCLVEEARMYIVVNRKMHEVYEKLTNKPFVTEDRRPVLLCYFCCTILKKCCRFQRKCLEAEELFAQMLDENYEPNPSIYPEYLEFDNGLVTIQMQHISIDGKCQSENHAVKKEKELQTDELESENPDHSDVEDIPIHHSDSKDDVSITEFKIEVEDEPDEQDLYWAPVAKKAKLQLRRTGLQGIITEEQKKNELSDSKVFRTTKNCTFKPVPKINDSSSSVNNVTLDKKSCNNGNKDDIRCKISNKDNDSDEVNRHRSQSKAKLYKCDRCQKSYTQNCHLLRHFRTHTGEKPYKCGVCQNVFGRKALLDNHMRIHTGEKPFHCDICRRSFSQKFYLTRHIRIHTGEKPYKCEVCQYSCNQKGDLTKHIRIHSDEKPYKCDDCEYSSNQKGVLKKHIFKHHIRINP